jgi:GNAT superfamily N-acetyltransferase
MFKDVEMQLRIFRVTDLDTLHSLVMETIDRSYSVVYPAQAVRFFKQYHCKDNIYSDCLNGYTVVAGFQGEVLGTGTLLHSNIRRVFVRKNYQRLGIGKIIMEDLESRAAIQGYGSVDLSASLVAKGFYVSLGYDVEEERCLRVENGIGLHYSQMSKRL